MDKPRIRILVSMRTGQCWPAPFADQPSMAPRKSRPRHSNFAHWTADELAILRATYPDGGSTPCLPLLPGRSAQAIKIKAQSMNIVCGRGRGTRLNPCWTEDEDEALRGAYPAGGATLALTRIPGRTRHSITLRARKIGVARGRGRRKITNPATVPVAVPTGGGDARLSAPPPKRRGPMSFEDQMEAVRNGARLIEVMPIRRADPAMTLGGTVGEII